MGRANGANPIAIVIPCHRVIGSNGKLTGYGGGLPRKEFLLALEQKQMSLPLASQSRGAYSLLLSIGLPSCATNRSCMSLACSSSLVRMPSIITRVVGSLSAKYRISSR